jgi:hypothetical protein
VTINAAIAGGDKADELEALLVEHGLVIFDDGVAAVERFEHVIIVAEDVG